MPVEIPVFTYGTYTSLGGADVTFTDQLMRDLVKNTNFAIRSKALSPPLGYDEVDAQGNYRHRGTEAHGQIVEAKFGNGVVSVVVDSPSEQFRNDVKTKRRLRVSGEFNPDFAYTDPRGNTVKVGPTIVGLAALGRHRPALKNPAIVPLAELKFADTISPADAWLTREELRAHGFVAQTFDGDRYQFSEVEVDPAQFTEQQRSEENDMDTKEVEALIAKQVTPLQTQITALTEENTKLKGQVKSFSESTKREGDTNAFCEALVSDRKQMGTALPKLFLDKARTILNDATFSEEHRNSVKELIQLTPGARIDSKTSGAAKGDARNGEDEDDDEPKALAALKPRHFADIGAHEAEIERGLVAFSEFRPDAFKGIERDQPAKIRTLQNYVRTRDLGDERVDA